MCILSVYALLKVVGYYELSVLSMSEMGFQKKHFGGWGELYPIFYGFFFNFAKSGSNASSECDSPICSFSDPDLHVPGLCGRLSMQSNGSKVHRRTLHGLHHWRRRWRRGLVVAPMVTGCTYTAAADDDDGLSPDHPWNRTPQQVFAKTLQQQ